MSEWAGHGPDSLSVTWLDDAERESNEFGYADGLSQETFRRLIKVARAAEAFLAAYDALPWQANLRKDVTSDALRSLLRGDEP